jgi:hypothetical protein
MGRTKTKLLQNVTSCVAQLYPERRASSRHQTTIMLKNEARADCVSQRGDINDDGFIFLPQTELAEGKRLKLEVRLPGLGEWIECATVVKGIAVRGHFRGVVGRLTATTGKANDALVRWRSLVKNKARKAHSAMGPLEQRND